MSSLRLRLARRASLPVSLQFRVTAAVSFLLVAAAPLQRVNAQTVALNASTAEGSRNSDMGTLHGGFAGYSHSLGESRFSWRVNVGAVWRSSVSVGTPCSGRPIQPGTCPAETLDERRRISTGAVGVGVDAVRIRGVILQLYAEALVGEAFTRDRGRTSGQSREASRVAVGGRIGVDIAWQPKRSRFGVFVGGATAGVIPLGVTDCLDCFIPFGGGFGVSHVSAGLMIGERR